MRSKLSLASTFLMLAVGIAPALPAQPDSIVYVVTYIEALRSQAAATRDLLTAYSTQSRTTEGNLQFRALQRIARPNHFAIVEAWSDNAAYERFYDSEGAVGFRAGLAPLLYSPPDRRIEHGLATAAQRDSDPQAVYVLTHVDVLPPSLEPIVNDLRALAAAGREEPGNLRFDVLVTERRNHMTIVEAWRSAEAQADHLGEPGYRAFRARLAPVLGALYDDRLYRAL